MPTEIYEVKDTRSIWRKLKALLTSRTDTLKQSDAVTDALMDKLALACANEKRATEAAAKFAQLVIRQHEAIVNAIPYVVAEMWEGTQTDPEVVRDALRGLVEARDASQAHL